MQKYSKEEFISIHDLEPYPIPIRQRTVPVEKIEGLKASILDEKGNRDAIVISTKKNSRGKYLIYRGSRRWRSHVALAKEGNTEFEKIKCKTLLNDDDPMVVDKEVYGTNDGAEWAFTDVIAILAKKYSKERFMEDARPGRSGGQGMALSKEISMVWSVPTRTAQYWITKVREAQGWDRTVRTAPKPYPWLPDNEFKFVARRAFGILKERKKISEHEKKIEEYTKDISSERLLNTKQLEAFLEDSKTWLKRFRKLKS